MSRIARSGIVPIVTVRDLPDGIALIDRLVEAGADVIEIVLRTPDAPSALKAALGRHPHCLFAAGTVLDEEGARMACDAGAHFLVSPGLTPELHEAASKSGRMLVPGVQTASEVMAARRLGYRLMKYYPAEPSNGLVVLEDYANIFHNVAFMATGKIKPDLLAAYGRLANVAAVGGSWMLKPAAMKQLPDDRSRFLAARPASAVAGFPTIPATP
jgi:2-dehydro-3-deoxyphosphogluconate aldolase/(4S)-4-hydroxy-2-oxoglutarate aldolase